jgi:Protein of unknown function (DUF998)
VSARSHVLPDLAVAGVIEPFWLFGLSIALGIVRPGYEPLRDAISELGERGAPNALLWNVGGFGVIAVLYAGFAIAVRAWFGSGWLFRLTVLQAIFVAAGASFNCDPGCPPVPQSGTMLGHIIAGLVYFAVTCVLPLIAWRTFRGRSEWASYARPSLLVGLALVALFLVGPFLGQDRVGVWQRTTLLVASGWQVAVALRLRSVLPPRRTATNRPEWRASDAADAPAKGT